MTHKVSEMPHSVMAGNRDVSFYHVVAIWWAVARLVSHSVGFALLRTHS